MLQKRICKQCGRSYLGGPRAFYCSICRAERKRESDRKCKARQRKGITRMIGSTDICKRCGNKYTVTASLQKFCPDCKIPHTLEYDRTTGLEYYHTNKDNINPSRNEKRRIGTRRCAWCGKEFESNNKKLTCSLECGRKRRNALWLEYVKKKGGK